MTDPGTNKFQNWLVKNTALSAEYVPGYARSVCSLYDSLRAGVTSCMSISGAPGTGKSTLAGGLCFLLREDGIAADWLSLDDYYLPKSQRLTLAAEVHPLFANRGVPGTHDLALLNGHIRSLLNLSADDTVTTPVFDKATDDRQGESDPRNCGLDYLIVEGWCLGCVPQVPEQLNQPVNGLEAAQDPGCAWRLEVNRQLEDNYRALNLLFDCHWYLQVPDWQQVIDWRWQQAQSEQHGFTNRGEVERFLQPFQRLVLHMQATTEHFDQIIQLDNQHHLLN